MITITLPDGSKKEFDKAVTVAEVAGSIGAGLAKAAVAGKVNGTLVDTFYTVNEDATLAIITDKDEEGLEIIRHSTAHLLAHAVKELYPETQITIGPVIENGFYYDFARDASFTEDDLEKIEVRMAEIAKRDHMVSRREIARDEAIDFFRKQGEEYKATIIEDLPKDETLSLYEQGDFIDLCRGPHVSSTGRLKAFKLTKLAGAYWRGDSNNEMLQRVYGTAWPDKKALKAYLNRLEEAKKRDHRVIAKKMDLYHLQPEAPGMVFWHPNGWTLYRVLQDYMREKNQAYGYEEVRTPIMADRSLWEKSGHWDKFREEMFITESEKRLYAIKPMNCPCHVQIYNKGLKSYKDLPVRLSEFGSCHRNEPSGTLHGLMRVRNMVQDDGHIFCTMDQIAGEVHAFIKQLQDVYTDFGFDNLIVRLATRPDKRVGSDEIWSKAEHALESVLNESGLEWDFNPGEGAFYGPKLEFSLKDCLERVWQCGTIQLDFSMPERLEAHYVADTGSKETPVMLHRAIFGTFERFLGILIEHYAGCFPLWLAPVQAVILNITDNQQAYCKKIAETLKNLGIRVNLDLRNEKIGFKIREHTIARVPYIIVIGDKELEANQVAVRTQQGVDLGAMSLSVLTARMEDEIAKKVVTQSGE